MISTKSKIKKSVIFLGYGCNNNCVFCMNADKRNLPEVPTREIEKQIIEAKQRGRTYLELIGGEPTIRSDILHLLNFAKETGFDTIHITTNGRMLSYPRFAKKFLKSGVTDLVFSIHGFDSKTHDELVQSVGGFDQLKKGIENIKKFGFKNIGSNTTIVKSNYKKLPKIGEFIYGLGIRNSEFIFVDPNYGGAYNNFKKLVPRISEAASYIRKCLDIGKNKSDHWAIRYVPLCYFEDYLDQISEIKEVKKFQTEHLAPDFKNLDVENSRADVGRKKPDKCKDCYLNYLCEGIWREYIKNFGDQELTPLSKEN